MAWAINALVVSLAVLATWPTSGEAAVERSGGYTYVSKKEPLKAGGKTTLAAKCPRGTRVLSGGGYNTSGFDTAILRHSYPFDANDKDRKPDDGWRAQWTTKTDITQISVYAICADMRVRYPKTRVTIGGSAAFDGGAPCDETWFAVGGGSSGPVRATQTKSFLSFSFLWRAVVEQISGPESKLRIFGTCLKKEPTFFSTSGGLPQGTQQGLEVDCPGNKRVVGGGAFSNTNVSGSNNRGLVLIAASRPLGHGAPGDDGWQAYYDNASTTDYAFSVVAACLPPRG